MLTDCDGCGKSFKGFAFEISINGKQGSYCAECYSKMKNEYSKKESCEECSHFDEDTCEEMGKLTPVSIGGTEFYVQRTSCASFSKFDPSAEGAVKFDKAKLEKQAADAAAADSLVKQLSNEGKTLTYYCCHCGAPLKVGAKSVAQKTCPSCGCDLTVIDMPKLISQHI